MQPLAGSIFLHVQRIIEAYQEGKGWKENNEIEARKKQSSIYFLQLRKPL